jgi:catechol 2,3-dioxygenase-like lactoylglutathione lyase family enzyme
LQEGDNLQKYKFGHIHLMSPDPLKTAEFYQKMFGAVLIKTRDMGNGRFNVYIDLSGVHLLISKTTDEKQFGIAHFGLTTDNLSGAAAELKAEGATFIREVTDVRPNFKLAFLQAPDTVSVEITEGNG